MILRILNPPHAGAQAEIGPDPLSIGSGEDCDLVLNDPLLQSAHCNIRRTGEGIEVELTGGAAHIDGEPVEKNPFIVRAGQVLSIGSTHMAFGDPGQVWSAISIPVLKTLGGSVPAVADAEKATSVSKKSDSPDPSVSAKADAMRRFRIAVLGSAVLLLVLLMALFFYRAEQNRAMTSLARVLVIQRSSEAMMSGSACDARILSSRCGGKNLPMVSKSSLNAMLPPGSIRHPWSS